MKLSELAAATGASLEGNGAGIDISGAAGLDEAKPGQVTFLANPRYALRVKSTSASAIYVGVDVKVDKDIALLRTTDPYLAYTRALILFHPEPAVAPFVHPSAVIDPTAKVAADVFIGAYVSIGRDVEIGSQARIHPHVVIYEGVRIGAASIIH